MPERDTVSHADIYHKLGAMEGKLESVLLQLSDKQSDLADVFTRLRGVELRVATGVGIAVCLSFIVPLLINAASPRLTLQQDNVIQRPR